MEGFTSLGVDCIFRKKYSQGPPLQKHVFIYKCKHFFWEAKSFGTNFYIFFVVVAKLIKFIKCHLNFRIRLDNVESEPTKTSNDDEDDDDDESLVEEEDEENGEVEPQEDDEMKEEDFEEIIYEEEEEEDGNEIEGEESSEEN